jgi:hypothetical protein
MASDGSDTAMGSRRRPTIAQSAMIENNFFPATRPMKYLLDAF